MYVIKFICVGILLATIGICGVYVPEEPINQIDYGIVGL